MNTLQLKQQTTNSWTVSNEQSGVLVAWISRSQNRLDRSNQPYQVVVRSTMTHDFITHENFESLKAVTAFLAHARIGVVGGGV